MSGSTNIIGLPISSTNPLLTTNGGLGRSVTPTAGSVLFYDSTGVQQNNSNLFWNNSSLGLSIGTTTTNSPLTVQVAGGTTYATALAAYFGSVVGGGAGNFYHITVAKGSYEAALLGINKNSTTGNIPASYVYLSTFSSTGGIALGQGNNVGLPNNAALIVTNQVNIPNLTAANLVVTDGSSNLVSTNTLSNTVLGNITKVTVTTFTSSSGTYTAPTNCTHIRVRMWGAGGGGGGVAGSTGNAGGAGGGGSGGYIESIITSPTSYSYGVGASGSGGAAGNNNGTQGGASTFSSYTAGGGTGGTGCTASLTASVVLAGTGSGNGGSATISFLGNSGSPGVNISGSVAFGGNGGVPPMGGGAPRGFGSTAPGVNGASAGAGGSGAISTTSTSEGGGNGAAGLITIEEYYNG